jgi:hypothetical protein
MGSPGAAVPSKPLRSFAGISLTSGVTRSTVTVQDNRKPPGTSKMDGPFGTNGRTRDFRFIMAGKGRIIEVRDVPVSQHQNAPDRSTCRKGGDTANG